MTCDQATAIRDPARQRPTVGVPASGPVTPPGPFRVIEGPYLRDLLDQPQALLRSLEGLTDQTSLAERARDLAAGRFRRVVLTGMGSSFHGSYPLHLALGRRGVTSLGK